MRTCQACGARMSPFQPRSRNAAGLLVCKGCRQREGARTAASVTCNALDCDNPATWSVNGPSHNDWGTDVCDEHKAGSVTYWSQFGEPKVRPITARRRVASTDPGWVGSEDPNDERGLSCDFGGVGSSGEAYIVSEWDDANDRLTGKWTWRAFRYDDLPAEGSGVTDTLEQAKAAATEYVMGGQTSLFASRRVVAHDSGDGETIYHCPFCGAGQVVGRSDGTAECGFCQTAFTVQVQPNMSAVPQTIDGVPHVHPDMPGADPGTVPVDEAPVETETALTQQEQDDNNAVFAKRYFLTAEAVALDEDAYMRHLAIKHANDRLRAVEAVRAARR